MATLNIKGEFVGPGEKKTAERLRDELPDDWVIFASRKLPGETRDDVDLIVVGQALVFLLEEKAWGPRIVCDDNNWYVNNSVRPNPLNRNAQLARIVASLLRDHASGYKNVKGKRVVPGVILSHDSVQVFGGNNHHRDENIWTLSETAAVLQSLDSAQRSDLGVARKPIIAYLDDRPAASAKVDIGSYSIRGRVDVPGPEVAYFARSSDDQEVILKCYQVHQLRQFGDPRDFLERETRALNQLAELGRTWRALPFFEDANQQVFVVPVIPPTNAVTLEESVKRPGPERPAVKLDDQVARDVVIDAFSALADVHEYKLVHRALHPRRVWLGRRMRVLFSDFHLARIQGDVSIALWAPDGDISEDYRAPECQGHVGLATSKSDVYSMALCLAYWLLGRSVHDMTLPEVAEALADAFSWTGPLAEALDPDPEKRPSSEDLSSRLTATANETAVTPTTSSTVRGVFAPDELIDGRYEIKRELGRGGFATSWLVYDRHSVDTKVLKQFHQGVPEELRAEYNVADRLRHELCAAVYNIRLDHEPHYLVSEYVEGESLAEAGIDRTVDEIRTVATDVLNALTYIHGKDLVHGDVAPGNIIVTKDGSGRAKLIDFGLAVPVGQRPHGWNPRFAAPEVVRGDTASSLSDLFGFAASMIFAMLGRKAFRSEGSAFEPLEPTEDERRIWGDEGMALLRIFFRAITAVPSDRPSSAEEFLGLVASTRPTVPLNEAKPDQSSLERRINPNVDAIRRLYRASSSGNAGNRGLDDEFAMQTYVPTLLDDALLPRVIAGELDVVLLSGNPGDGKTSLLVQLGKELRSRGASEEHEDAAGWRLRLKERLFIAVFDASESHGDLTSDELLHEALRPVAHQTEGPATALIAINDGRLLQFFTDYENEYEDWKLAIDDQIAGRAATGSRLALVDLKRRTLAGQDDTAGLASRALSKLTESGLWDVCTSCEAHAQCPILANRDVLAGSGKAAFNELMLISHLRRRRRATFRDVRSAAAWLITGDRDCEDVHQLIGEGRTPRLAPNAMTHDLAFASTSRDYLIDEWSDVDPATVAAPTLDSYRRSAEGGRSTLRFASTGSIARALYFRELDPKHVHPDDVRAYRYLDEFLHMLTDSESAQARARMLLGISRLVGAYGYVDSGLAVSSGMAESAWAVLHVIPAEEFVLSVNDAEHPYVETMPDMLTLTHRAGSTLALTLDTAEIILRAADGELVNDPSSDAIRQEIDSFVNQLGRQPSTSARIVDSSGSVAIATVHDQAIKLEHS